MNPDIWFALAVRGVIGCLRVEPGSHQVVRLFLARLSTSNHCLIGCLLEFNQTGLMVIGRLDVVQDSKV
jgi:hypothetical protein